MQHMKHDRFHSMVALVRTRRDLDHQQTMDYWSSTHAHKVRTTLPLVEYRQHHFDPGLHGFWPSGTVTPPDWPLDGIAELDRGGLRRAGRALLAVRRVWFDEQNVFDVVDQHAHLTANAHRWETPDGVAASPARAVLLMRRRHGVPRRRFDAFVHDRLGRVLAGVGSTEVRTHTFLPPAITPYPTPGVQHQVPPQRRTDAVIIVGATDRDALLGLAEHPRVRAALAEQALVAASVRSHAVLRTVEVIPRR